MGKNIQTHEADLNLVKKFLDYANCADASYALLEYIFSGEIKYKKDNKEQIDEFDTQTQGDKFNGKNSTYARTIEARFNEDRTGDWCFPFTNICLTTKDKIPNNDITQVKLDSKLSQRTIDFVNRFKLLAHQENTSSGFSAILFEDTQ